MTHEEQQEFLAQRPHLCQRQQEQKMLKPDFSKMSEKQKAEF